MPIKLPARAVFHGKGTKQTALFIPLAARAMQNAVAIRQFLGELTVMMPGAVETVEFACHFPGLRLDAAIPVIKPFYANLGHVVVSTGLSLLAGFCTSWSGQGVFLLRPSAIGRARFAVPRM
jgi:hypothetical protein